MKPVKLHDENIAAIERLISMSDWSEHNASAAQLLLAMALAEIRASRLTPEDIEALRRLRENYGGTHYPDYIKQALAVLDRLTGAQQADKEKVK